VPSIKIENLASMVQKLSGMEMLWTEIRLIKD